MGKHLVDIDEGALRAARTRLRTDTIKGTVNEALRRSAPGGEQAIAVALDTLAGIEMEDRTEAWRSSMSPTPAS